MEKERRIKADPLKYARMHDKQIEATNAQHPIRVLFWANRCFSAGTLVATPSGQIPIEHLKVGDYVLSLDGHNLVSKKVVRVIVSGVDTDPKPMIQFTHGDKTTTCTYDHPYRVGDSYVPIYQLAWGSMETSQRLQLELLCKQYGQTIDDQSLWWKQNSSDEACTRYSWILENNDGWSNSETTQSSSTNLDTKPTEQANSEPYRQQPHQQQGRELRMGDIQGTSRASSENWNNGKELGGVERSLEADQRGCDKDVQVSRREQLAHEVPDGTRATHDVSSSESRLYQGCIKREVLEICEVSVLPAEKVYDIEVEETHNFFANGINVHNCGKSEWGAMEVARYVLNQHPAKKITLPIDVWCACPSYDAQIETTQKKLQTYIPESEIEHISYIKSGAWGSVRLKNGSTISFKSYEQGREKFQGAGRRLIWFDEEPPHDIWEEAFVRSEAGVPLDIIMTMTPVKGMCFDEQTKVLSENGWVGIDDLSLGDNIFTVNKTSLKLELKPVDFIYRDQSDKDMVRMTCQGFDSLTTGDHRWYVKSNSSNAYQVVTTNELKKHHVIPRVVPQTFDPTPIHPDWLVSLIGWVVTDGTLLHRNSSVRLYQSLTVNKKKCDEIERLLAEAGANVRMYDARYHQGEKCEGVARHYTIKGDVAKTILRLVPNKELTGEFISSLSMHQQQLLFDALIAGDGSHNKNGYRFVSEKKYFGNVEAMMMLCQLLGKRCTYTLEKDKYYRLHIQDSIRYGAFTHVSSLKRTPEEYSGRIWCPHTENETVIAMRNGSSYVSMNTWVYDEIYLSNNPDIFISKATWMDNPWLTPKQVEQMSRGLSQQALKVRAEGEFVSRSGLVCQWFDRKKHIVNVPYDPQWDVYVAIDFGFSSPACVLFIGVNYDDDIFIFDGFYATKLTTPDIASKIKAICNEHNINVENILAIADSAQAESIQQLLLSGISTVAVKKQSGTDNENWDEFRAERMQSVSDKLFVSDKLMFINEDTGYETNFFAYEAENLKWDTRSGLQLQRWDDALPDHAIDAYSYFLSKRFASPAAIEKKPWHGKVPGTYRKPRLDEDITNQDDGYDITLEGESLNDI